MQGYGDKYFVDNCPACLMRIHAVAVPTPDPGIPFEPKDILGACANCKKLLVWKIEGGQWRLAIDGPRQAFVNLDEIPDPEAAAAIEKMKTQLLIVLVNRLGGEITIPASEIDNTGGLNLVTDLSPLTREYHFQVVERVKEVIH